MFLFPQMIESFEVSCALRSERYLMLHSPTHYVSPVRPRIEDNLNLFWKGQHFLNADSLDHWHQRELLLSWQLSMKPLIFPLRIGMRVSRILAEKTYDSRILKILHQCKGSLCRTGWVHSSSLHYACNCFSPPFLTLRLWCPSSAVVGSALGIHRVP